MNLGPQSNDQALLAQLRDGDSYAFDVLYQKYWDKVYGEAFKRLQNVDKAKDITQEVFVSLWAKRKENFIDNLPAYLFVSVRNNVFKLQKKASLFSPIEDLLDDLYASPQKADAKILEHEFFKALAAFIEALTPAQQQIFKMHYQEELSTKEIAERLQISRKTVQNQLGKAVIRLRTMMTLLILLQYIGYK